MPRAMKRAPDPSAKAQGVTGRSTEPNGVEGLYRALGEDRDGAQPQRCDACFTGEYPTTLTDLTQKEGGASLSLIASR